MQGRTFFRIMLDIVLNNALVKSLASLVNFCNELRYYNRKELKFLKKMPINNNVVKEEYYKNRFIFNSITAIGLVQDNMLTNVTNKLENRQLFKFTCFIIHVGLDRIGVNAYA